MIYNKICLIIGFLLLISGNTWATPASQNPRNGEEFAYLMFTKTGCQYCDQQKQIFKISKRRLPFAIREINISNSRAAALRFDIKVTPTIILVSNKTDAYIELTAGVQDVPTLMTLTRKAIGLLQKQYPKKEEYLFN